MTKIMTKITQNNYKNEKHLENNKNNHKDDKNNKKIFQIQQQR